MVGGGREFNYSYGPVLHRIVLGLLLVVLGSLAWPASVRADARRDLERARNHYENGQYEEAVGIFARLLGEPLDPDARDYKKLREIHQAARPIYAACLVALQRNSEADALLLAQLRDDPFYDPSPGQLPQPVVQRLIEVRGRHRTELEHLKEASLKARQAELRRQQLLGELQQKRLATLEKMAAEERLVEVRSRLAAMAPFGIGQFQNGDTALGVFFAAGEVGGLVATITSGVIAEKLGDIDCRTDTDPDTGEGIDCVKLEERFLTARTVNWISFGTTAALVVAGIIEAEVALVPEKTTTRKRAIPPRVKVEPTVEANEHAVALGVRVSF